MYSEPSFIFLARGKRQQRFINLLQIATADVSGCGLDLIMSDGSHIPLSGKDAEEVRALLMRRSVLPTGDPVQDVDSSVVSRMPSTRQIPSGYDKREVS